MAGAQQSLLVTGAAGFIGSHVAQALAARGDRVIGLDNFDSFYDRGVKQANVGEVERAAAGRFQFVEGDICDATAMQRLFDAERFTGVIHLAARAGVRPSIADPVLYARVNVEGTTVLLEAVRRARVPRFVLASSSSVYGDAEKVPFAEDDDVSRPISPYAATKRACELIGATFHQLYALPVACLRFFTVYGPRQRPDLAIAQFLRRISAGQSITLYGDGSTSRDYTYIDDIVAGVLAAYDRVDRFGYRIWNLGGSNPVTLTDLVGVVERTVGRRAEIERRPEQAGDVRRTFADLARSRAELGYSPATTLEEGIRRQWAWGWAR